jgi:hypothetical protein
LLLASAEMQSAAAAIWIQVLVLVTYTSSVILLLF